MLQQTTRSAPLIKGAPAVYRDITANHTCIAVWLAKFRITVVRREKP